MPSPRTGIAPIVICTDCGYQQPIAIGASGSPQACQNCAADLHFNREVACPHCRKSVPWSPDLGQCPWCAGGFAPGIPLKPKPARSLSKVLAGALDVTQARKWDHLEVDARRRSEGLYRLWAALSRNEDPPEEESPFRSVVHSIAVQPEKRLTPWYGRWGVWVAVTAILALVVWGGVAAWHAR